MRMQISDNSAVEAMVDEVLAAHPKEVRPVSDDSVQL
jgi:Asp-tRNA(Asn)/Glu-tRNA(Gln) amidotransferase B subunit